MTETRIKISSVLNNQLPQFVREEFPLVSEFLSQYYVSLENQGGTSDILQNIDQYVKVDNLTNLIESTTLTSEVTFFDSVINVSSTAGFPDSYGLLLIDSEIITYTSKTSTTFEGCVRGFSGITSYDELKFEESDSQQHISGSIVNNLSILFLKEFLVKVKKQITPGFETRELYSELNERIFIKQAIDFYSSKGTDNSFKILFGALYGERVEVIRPRDYLIQPSDAQYRITSDLVVEAILGNPEDLINTTLYQDPNDFMGRAQGTITKVERIRRGDKDYYVISLDSDYDKDILPIGTVYGKFALHPKTRTLIESAIGTSTLEVDSTVGFPVKNGTLLVELENGTSLNISYTSKTLNQFLGCSGIAQNIPENSEIKTDFYAYGYGKDSDEVRIRILGVLSELEIPEDTRFYSKGDNIKIKTLGVDLSDYKSNNWFFNVPVSYDVKSVELLDISDLSYRIVVYDNHTLKVGDLVTIISSSDDEKIANVTSYDNEKSFTIQLGPNQLELTEDFSYTVKKNLVKVLSENYPSLNQFTSNVQNVYVDGADSLYVASPSLPTYFNQPLKINDSSITFSGTFDGDILNIGKHGLYTGDSIVYKPSVGNTLGIGTGVYFIKKVSETEVKLSRSRSGIFTENFVSVNGTVINAKFELADFVFRNLSTQNLESQKLIRKISSPEIDGNTYQTEPGLTGIFINGVELLNYKSKDNVFYGPIEEIIPTSGGFDYDVINPPVLSIVDPIGFGANAYCSIKGELKRIDIIDPGFDYLEEPKIEIFGGNGFGASAKAKLVSFDHEVSFNSQISAGLVKINPINSIGFSTEHKFRDAEEVVYVTNGQSAVAGLATNSTYFVSVQDAFTVKLHKSFSDAVSGINTIQLISNGTGNHSFKSKDKKKKIGSITIENSGFNYENKLTVATSSGINTASDIINIKNHGYESGEVIVYNSTETNVGGLSSGAQYYVTKVSDDEFRLSNIGIGSLGITTSFYYDTKQYINLISAGSGNHKFNYPEIRVSVKGRIGVSTFSGQDFNAVVQPIFRGEIQSVFVESGGSNYGSEDIINFNRQPLFELNSGSGIQLKPIISNGQITDVLINSPGSGYNSPPNLEVIGDGAGALLTPIFSNGSLVQVKVIYGGGGYNQDNTAIIATPSGFGADFESAVKSWKINLVERAIQNSKIANDDGLLTTGLNNDYGLQYSHAYAPRPLRSLVQGTSFRNGKVVYTPDLAIQDKREIESSGHSPIIGWAYDGNPIYGPYGYSSATGGSVKSLTSGYEQRIILGRPSTSIYPQGFFVEDYDYVGNGDLDEHNGRFGITPEFPNGVYAYFTTINSGNVERTGLFENYKLPSFPYAIGNSYKSKPIDFNFENTSNQDFIDINDTGWRRNTTPYNLISDKTTYKYLLNPNKIKQQNSVVKNIFPGDLESITIVDGGEDYKVGDKLVFKNKGNFISSGKAKVSSLFGKAVTQISVATSSFDDVVLYPNESGSFVGFTTIPHYYVDNDLITFTGQFDYKKSSTINVNYNNLFLTSGIGSAIYTGLVTYFNVSGNLSYPNIRENDIYQIGNEEIKVLSIDPISSRIKVLRNQNGTVGLVTYGAGIGLTEKTKRFSINFGISTSYNYRIDREFYFEPKETVGLGTLSGVGIVSTIYFSNPGVGITQISIPTQSLYLPNHNLITGDSLIYSANGGTRVSVSTDGNSSFQLDDNLTVYVAKISNDLIGISTIKVGIGSTGTFVGMGSTASGILYFTSVGTGNTHSFRTNYKNSLVGSISKNVVTVSTGETHGLSLLDKVTIDVKTGIATTFIVKYDDYSRRMLINPRQFSSVDIENNRISINNHKYYTGQKILHTSNSPATGLVDHESYYVIVVDSDTIMLSSTYYGATKLNPEIIDITTSSTGTISAINPPITVERNHPIIFDLSDSSLSFFSNVGVATYSAFDLKIYKDSKFSEEFNSTSTLSIFEVSRSGRVGIDSTAKLTILVGDEIPNNLYYKLVPINLNLSPQVKKEIIKDSDVISGSQISLVKNRLNDTYSIVGIGSTTFKFNILDKPDYDSLSSVSSEIYYYTDSTKVKGAIKEISLTSRGRGYTSLPSIGSVISEGGSGAILIPETKSIGRVSSTEIQDIGFEYPTDYSLRPLAKYPTILVLEPLFKFDSVGISSFGKDYSTAPSLVVVNGNSGGVIEDVELTYTIGSKNVSINKNSSELTSTPRIIPINNSNGIRVKNIVFNNSTKNVVVTLGSSFSDPEEYPFAVGSKILIEGVSVGVASTGKGYNSSNYAYSLFTLTAIDPNIGGADGTLTFNLSSYLKDGETPGTFSSINSAGRVVPESYFPIFDIKLKKNIFYEGETVYTSNASAIVENWDEDNEYLKVSTINDFSINQKIEGRTSGSVGIIKKVIDLDSNYKIDSSSPSRKGWNRETGFLNNTFQRVQDSDYYQYFSYDLKSTVDLNTWINPVNTLNHTAGFKKFGNLISESIPSNSGISTDQNQGDFIGISDLSAFVDLNCVNDFDLASENTLNIDGSILSNEIIFNSAIIQDYIESIGNRVLTIDDISSEFNSNPRATQFSIVDNFVLNDYRSKKYIIFARDKRFVNETQLSLVTFLHDNSTGFLNQYGVRSFNDLGFFDFSVFGTEGSLLFYPTKAKRNDYHLGLFSFSLSDLNVGIGSTNLVNLGDSVSVGVSTTNIASGSLGSIEIVGISSTYRSGKVLVQIGATDSSYYQYDEISYIYDGSEVRFQDYGQLSTDTFESTSTIGIGTYDAYLSGSNIRIDLIIDEPTSVEYIINTFVVSLGNTTTSGIGTQILSGSSINSSSVSIASSSSPTSVVIGSYLNDSHNSSYSVISIEDISNSQYQLSEFLTVTNNLNSYDTEFGVLQTENQLGIITSGISGSYTNIYFTPNENIEVDVKLFKVDVGLNEVNEQIDLTDAVINYDYGIYTGTDNDVRKHFNLNYRTLPIFQRYFDASDESVINVDTNVIRIPYHTYVTGEEIAYSYPGVGTTQAIGIATTSISGIGLTDKLPSTLYVVKINDIDIQVSASSSEALKTTPDVLDITSVGIGSSHIFTAKNQNNKAIITLDNAIQSPVVSTSTTTTAIQDISFFDFEIYLSSADLISGGDLLKIDDEIMKVYSVGVGSTNVISVIRPWLGTVPASHTSSSLVTKVLGDYNIVGSTIHFTEAPFGKIPFINPSNRPDEVDYIGISTGSSFSGRVFLRSGIPDTLEESYTRNYIFDDISDQFNAYADSFILKNNGNDVSGISTNNAIVLINGVFQPSVSVGVTGVYDLTENAGITSITFIGEGLPSEYDVNTTSLPRGGVILSIASTSGFGYQPLVSAGGTAVVSSAGTIQSISIGNSGSGYRDGIQNIVNVGVKTENLVNSSIEFIGTASVLNGSVVSIAITNPGIGYTTSNPPIVVFDSPLSYSNIPLVYSSESSAGFGTGATIDIVVGQGSSVTSFELKNLGYAYKKGEILTVSIGGTTGIQTTSLPGFSEFQVTIDTVQSDQFAAWTVGSLQVIDPLDSLFDGERTVFPILIEGNQTTIRSKMGSIIDQRALEASLLIFINDVLQVPGEGYAFKGGSTIRFTEAPKVGDTSKIVFYRGTVDIDTLFVDILETIKIGDKVTLNSDDSKLVQNDRLVNDIISSDTLETNLYPGPAVTQNENLLRPLIWCRQTEDLFVDGQFVGKDRVIYEPYIQPNSNIIQNFGIGSTEIFVESVKTFFDSDREYEKDGTTEKPQNKILIISQDTLVSASATAVVSTSGTITSVLISDGGVGYSTSPTISIGDPIGIGITGRAQASSIIVDGIVTSIEITSPGFGYTTSNPPEILIEHPSAKYEVINNISYTGDFGIISGIKTTSVGVASTGIVFDFYIPENSPIRDGETVSVGIATTGISGIETGYYFAINKSNVGNGLTSLNSSGGTVGVGTTFIDNIYQVASVSIAQTAVAGVGITYVAQVTVSVSDFNGLSGLGFSGFYGEYSWGRISTPIRKDEEDFESYANIGGMSTSPIVQRFNRLKFRQYST